MMNVLLSMHVICYNCHDDVWSKRAILQCWICFFLLWWNVSVWPIVPKCSMCEYLMTWGILYMFCDPLKGGFINNNVVTIIWSCWPIYTGISCITMSMICSWCQYKGQFSYAPLSLSMHEKYMTNEVWTCVF